jgi:hypothetical protein
MLHTRFPSANKHRGSRIHSHASSVIRPPRLGDGGGPSILSATPSNTFDRLREFKTAAAARVGRIHGTVTRNTVPRRGVPRTSKLIRRVGGLVGNIGDHRKNTFCWPVPGDYWALPVCCRCTRELEAVQNKRKLVVEALGVEIILIR